MIYQLNIRFACAILAIMLAKMLSDNIFAQAMAIPSHSVQFAGISG